jgi:hypothetical protein
LPWDSYGAISSPGLGKSNWVGVSSFRWLSVWSRRSRSSRASYFEARSGLLPIADLLPVSRSWAALSVLLWGTG